jgi:hypothetical protein
MDLSSLDLGGVAEAPSSIASAPPPLPEAAAGADPLDDRVSFRDVVEMMLKDRRRLDRHLRDETGQRRVIPFLLAIAVSGFALFGLTVTVLLNLIRQASGYWLPAAPASYWSDASAANLTLAYVLGLIAANGICLPSFYFYGLLSGVRISMLGATAHALKGMAAGAVALVGILPAYVPVALSAVIWSDDRGILFLCASAALALPFIAGLWGVISLYDGFVGLSDTIPCDRREGRRCLLRRLVLAWSGCYTFVTPLVIYTLWYRLAQITS